LSTHAKQTDMPEQAWALPTILNHAGVNFLHIGANSVSKPDPELDKIPMLSWWEGPDGSRILLGFSKEGFGIPAESRSSGCTPLPAAPPVALS
jgi:hypothetical protein